MNYFTVSQGNFSVDFSLIPIFKNSLYLQNGLTDQRETLKLCCKTASIKFLFPLLIVIS